MNNKNSNGFTRRVYICQNKLDNIRLDSTSGGAFSAISQFVLERKGIVFGVEFDDNYRVVHTSCEKQEDIGRFRGSKYVQSHLGKTFQDVKKQLIEDRWVFFTGTPCQVEGLKAFLGKDYEKLILMDFVCYSIASPGIWREYLAHLEKSKKVSIKDVARIKFRDKTKYGYEYTLMTFYDIDGKVIYSSGPESNQMLRSFVSNTATRPSCYECKFKKINRVSDFTVWDCYNVYQYDKQMDDNKGTSHLMVHTPKGAQILKEIKQYLILSEVNMQKAVDSESAMTECASPSEMRKEFFEAYKVDENIFENYFPDSGRVKMERFLRRILSNMGLYVRIKRCIKGWL